MNDYLVSVWMREFGGHRIIPRECRVKANTPHDARLIALHSVHKEGLSTCGVKSTEELRYSRP